MSDRDDRVRHDATLEWLQTNELGSFALGTVDRVPRRKYHSLLTVRSPDHGEPWNVLMDVAERIDANGETFLLHNLDHGAVLHPTGARHLVDFHAHPVPQHRYQAGRLSITRTLSLAAHKDIVRVAYRFRGVETATHIQLTPLLRCRPWHALTRENPWLNGAVTGRGPRVRLTPYRGMPELHLALFGAPSEFVVKGTWWKDVHYAWEQARGYDHVEDVYAPGGFEIDIDTDTDFWLAVGLGPADEAEKVPVAVTPQTPTLELAARQFFVRGAKTHGIIAGYPWFDEWGRDTLIALPGLCLEAHDWDRAGAILRSLAERRVHGLVPNNPARSDLPANTNSIDASLLFVRAVKCLAETGGPALAQPFLPVVFEILDAIADGADERVRLDDGLGVWVEAGPWALSWMDALIDGQPVTPRHGFAVEIDALMYNAVAFALEHAEGVFARRWQPRMKVARTQLFTKYWSEELGFLADGHDGERADFSLRPNQLWALALPHGFLPKTKAKRALAKIKQDLFTPAGLRTLAPSQPGYSGRYQGSQPERDRAYHQGTVWPFLLGIYADALYRVHGMARVRAELAPSVSFFENHLVNEGCVGQISEVFSGDPPHRPGGAPAQAWSVAELRRVLEMAKT